MIPSSSKARVWLLAGVFAVLAILGAGFGLVALPQVNAMAENRQRIADAEQEYATLDMKLQRLKQQYQELPTKQAELAAVRKAMPDDQNLPGLVRDLQSLAESSGVTLMKISPGSPRELAQSAGAAPAAPGAAGAVPGDTPGAQPNGANAAGTPVAAGGPTVTEIPVVLDTVGTFNKSEVFLRGLSEDMDRALIVDNLDVKALKDDDGSIVRPKTKNGDTELRISARVFVLTNVIDEAPQVGAPAQGGS